MTCLKGEWLAVWHDADLRYGIRKGGPIAMQELWIDQDGADELIEASDASPLAKKVAMDLRQMGISVVERAIDPKVCKAAIEDYADFCAQNSELVKANLDVTGREKRLVNFHLWSKNALKIVTNDRLLEALDYVFDMKTSVYTSLTFKYGTQQPVHRDTPHFSTWPASYFVGMWTALEDVHESAGALFYHPGAHKVKVDHRAFIEEAKRREPDAPPVRHANIALELYNGKIIELAPSVSEATKLHVKAGDTVIWHPQMPHGGSLAGDPSRSRWSIVAHCAPEAIAVNQYYAFFHHFGDEQPDYWYKFQDDSGGRKIALTGDPAFM